VSPAGADPLLVRLRRSTFIECRALVLLYHSPRSRIPADLDSVTRVRWEAEVAPRELGVDPDARDRVWDAARRLYRSGIHPALALCVRRHGQVLLDRAIGHVRGNGPGAAPDDPRVQLTPDSPFVTLSASKAVTAMMIHLLDQRNLLRLDDPVCEYIPEFAANGKQWITIRHILIHRAGIQNLPSEVLRLENLEDTNAVVRIIAEQRPTGRAGRQLAYHAVTGGFVLGEVVRRITGKSIRTLLDEEVRRPLGFRWLGYGVEPADLPELVSNYVTGPPLLPPLAMLFRRALGVDFQEAVAISNDPRFLLGIIPSGNVVATANEMSRFFQLLLDGGVLDGVRVFEDRTIRRATVEHSYLELDLTLGLPFRYGMGFMLGGDWLSPYGPYTPHAFGHVGLTNIVCWADPERRVAAALLTSGKPVLYPELYYLFELLRQIGLACPPVPR
jgi:CubicO group peptidase (beta-lactamase class C family)